MKKNLLLCILLMTGSVILAQEKTRGLETGLGFGVGFYTGDYSSTLMNADINVDFDYFLSKQFSIFGHIDYNRSFSSKNTDAGSFGFATSHIGPRVHFAKIVFVGIGAGTAFFTDSYGSSWNFSYYPQAGVVLNHTQLSVGYKAWTYANSSFTTGMMELGVIFKLNKLH
ncbi:MAG: hypothetical protein ACHQEM_04755 [Chitinophagales bacterium]